MSSIKQNWNRRKFIKGLAGLPILGGLSFVGVRELKYMNDKQKKSKAMEALGLKNNSSLVVSKVAKNTKHVRLGIIGAGARGKSLLRACGFVSEEWIKNHKADLRLKTYQEQYDLNVSITAVCDIFDLHAEEAFNISSNPLYSSGVSQKIKKYKLYTDLLNSSDVDAVIIATPDHWHARITMDAAKAGKHVYCEKCMTRTEEEAVEVYDTIVNSNIVFQLGHQNRQHASVKKAHEIYQQGTLGDISTIETFSNRNSDYEAWIRHIGKPGDSKSIDWNQFIGNAPLVPFDIKRFYNWTHFWDYGTGMCGQLFSHEFDIINQITNIGIPQSVVATGGIYHFNDGREVPDIFNAVFNYPKQKLTLTYDATLANSSTRNAIFLGSDASMELGQEIKVQIDRKTKKHKQLVNNEIIEPSRDIFLVDSETHEVDAVSSATQKYYTSRGLTFTKYYGKTLDATHLHIQDWLTQIREGGKTSCGIEHGFAEAISCHMATRAFRENRTVFWDPENRKIV